MSRVLQQLGYWQQELLDLSNRNRLLNFRPSTTRPTSIQLITPDASTIFAELLQGKSYVIKGIPEREENSDDDSQAEIEFLIDEDDSRDVEGRDAGSADTKTDLPPGFAMSNLPEKRSNSVALRLLRQARTSEQEQGINIFFAVFGLLKWREGLADASHDFGQHRRAPLLLLPLSIEENVRDGHFRIMGSGDDPEFNQTLAERLRRDFGLELPLDMTDEQALADFFNLIREAINQRQEWEVLEEVHIGLFQYHKIRMFKDLNEHAHLAAEHDIIKALAQEGVTIAGEPDGIPSEDHLDRLVHPQDSHSVLDADASQLEAVQAVIRGAHLLIQGPPGTGKSQTIANIIAECIAAGKKVLFVSEKAAAIEVVHRRLTQHGLGDFCLMLHSHNASKRDVIYDLAAQMEPIPATTLTAKEELRMQQLSSVRQNLNGYVEALHRNRAPLGVSAYWAHGELARLESLPFLITTIPPVDTLTLEILDRWQFAVSHVSTFHETLSEGMDHPWSSYTGTSLGLAQGRVLQNALTSFKDLLAEIRRSGPVLATALGIPEPMTLTAIRRLIRIANAIPNDTLLHAAWFDTENHEHIAATAREAAARASALQARADALFEVYTKQILEVATPETTASYAQGTFARLFSGQYREARSRMRGAARDGEQRSRDEEVHHLQIAREVKDAISWFEERLDFMRDRLAVSIQAETIPDVAQFTNRLAGLSAVSAILAEYLPDRPEPQCVQKLCLPDIGKSSASALDDLTRALQRAEETLAQLGNFFVADHLTVDGTDVEHVPLEQLEGIIATRLARWSDLQNFIGSRIAMQRIDDEGLRNIIDTLLGNGIPAEQWSDAFRKVVLTHWLDTIYQSDAVLGEFRGQDHSERITAFRDLDHHLIDTGPQRLRRLLASQRAHLGAAISGEPGLLRHEAAKRRRHIPLRRLFAHIPNLLPTLKPCMMMSPLSVAQFLPADRYRFDVVIFDEASQVRPHDAIGAILRGGQLVVAGDSQQLPPTSFFDRVDEFEPTEQNEDLRSLESILDGLRAKNMPTRSLLWHYRSRHEDLIAYSNHHFYDDRLITFPSPSAEPVPGRGVRLEYVPDGRYELETDSVLKTTQRVNRVEAKRVAQLVMRHARTRPGSSLGVVALGTTQRDIVEDEIRQARLLDQSCEEFFRPDNPDPFFVKALEQVQGDERDVMMITIGFGKNAQGVLSHNFGPINRDGGERRLNVLVTRARHEVVVVSSIRGSDIDLTRTQKLGPRLLKNYLDFAEHGKSVLNAQITGGDGEYESPFEAAVGKALERVGYTVHRQVGASKFRIDLAVVHPEQPGRYLLGIECDGRTYHQSKTARDRDRLRQEVLEGLGWTIHRIWSTVWIRHPQGELNRVVGRIQELLEIERSAPDVTNHFVEETQASRGANHLPSQEQVIPADSAQSIAVTTIAPPLSAEPYQTTKVSVVGYGAIWDAPLPAVMQAIADCVHVEGPVHKDVLMRRVVSAWGHQRSGNRIVSLIDQAILNVTRQQDIVLREGFLWPSADAAPIARGANEYGDLRDMKHIADEELFEGVKQVLRHAFSLSEQELISQTARFFGYQRTGADIARRLRELLASRLQDGMLEYRTDRYTLPTI